MNEEHIVFKVRHKREHVNNLKTCENISVLNFLKLGMIYLQLPDIYAGKLWINVRDDLKKKDLRPIY